MDDLNKKEEELIEEGIAYSKKKALLARLNQLEESMPEAVIESPRKAFSINRWKAISIAASIALIIGLGWWLLRPAVSPHEKFFAMHFKPYPSTLLNLNKSGSETANLKTKAAVAYASEDFNTAIPLFKELTTQGDTISSFYLGVSYLGNNEPDKAIEALISFRKTATILTNQSAQYLALAYLKKGEIKNIELLVQNLEDSPQKEMIQRILNEIKVSKK